MVFVEINNSVMYPNFNCWSTELFILYRIKYASLRLKSNKNNYLKSQIIHIDSSIFKYFEPILKIHFEM